MKTVIRIIGLVCMLVIGIQPLQAKASVSTLKATSITETTKDQIKKPPRNFHRGRKIGKRCRKANRRFRKHFFSSQISRRRGAKGRRL